jgi:hypothetical protein
MADIESRMETRVRGKGENGEERDYNRTTRNLVYASFVHTVTRPIDGIPDPHYHIHGFTFNATFDAQENRWKAGQFMNRKLKPMHLLVLVQGIRGCARILHTPIKPGRLSSRLFLSQSILRNRFNGGFEEVRRADPRTPR